RIDVLAPLRLVEKASADPARLVRLFKRLADDCRSRVGEAVDREDLGRVGTRRRCRGRDQR
ncbi:unnamed protein product, partial [Pelagomonas calceolata]